MQIGIILPQNEIGDDPGAIREFSAAAEDEGFEHIVAFDHVVGKDDYASQPFHEPFVLFGFIAACTRTIELVTGIIILPQRQTALRPSRPPRSTCSPAAACGSGSAWAGIRSSTRRWARTSTRAASAWTRRSR